MNIIFIFIPISGIDKIVGNDYGNSAARNLFERFQAHLKQSGVNNFKNYLEELLDEWKNISVHIGVTGQSGVGKSTFINTMRRLRSDDPRAAHVGVKETTTIIESYPDNNNINFVYWDLPGCGTSNFPRDTYLEKVNFDKFDFLIIITTTRFTEDDHWLVSQAKKYRKLFFLVRNKINVDIESEREDHPSHPEQAVIETIRSYLSAQFNNHHTPIYLLSTRLQHYSKWDFPKLVEDLLKELSTIKQHLLAFSIASNSKTVLQKKAAGLRQRVWLTATLSAGASVLPVPGLSVFCDLKLLHDEIQHYKKALELDTDSLISLLDKNGVTMDMLKAYYMNFGHKYYYELIFGKELLSYLTSLLTRHATKSVAKEVLRYIPIVGQVLSSTMSFGITFMALNDVLDDLHIASNKLLDFIASKH